MSAQPSRLPTAVPVALAIVAAGLLLASPARASLEIELQSGGQTYTQTGTSPLSVSQSIGNFTTSIDMGLATSTPSLELDSANLNTAHAGTLVITLSEDGLTGPLGPQNWLSQLIGNTISKLGVTVTLKSYLDASDTLLGTGTLLSSVSDSSTPINLSANGTASMTGPFAITEVLTIHALGAAVTSLSGSVAAQNGTPIPEPASLALLGAALLGCGMVRARRG